MYIIWLYVVCVFVRNGFVLNFILQISCMLFHFYTILCVQIHNSTLTQAFHLTVFTLDICASLDPKELRLFFFILIFCSVNLSSVYAPKNTIIAENIKINGTMYEWMNVHCTCKGANRGQWKGRDREIEKYDNETDLCQRKLENGACYIPT